MKLGTILVPLDGSPLAETALPEAVQLAAASGAQLLLLRATEGRALPGWDPTEAQVTAVAESEDYLATVAERLRAAGPQRVETSTWYGPAAAALVEAARLHHVDLIVMTSHGRSGLGRLILGSVAESVLRGTRTPILLLRAPEAPVDPPPAKGVGQPRPASPPSPGGRPGPGG